MSLEELTILDQFIHGVLEKLGIHLRERKPKSLQEAMEMADDYTLARRGGNMWSILHGSLLCTVSLSYSGNTLNLAYHVQHVHPCEYWAVFSLKQDTGALCPLIMLSLLNYA